MIEEEKKQAQEKVKYIFNKLKSNIILDGYEITTMWIDIPKTLTSEHEVIVVHRDTKESLTNKAARPLDILNPFVSPLIDYIESMTDKKWQRVTEMQDSYYRSIDLIIGRNPYSTAVDYHTLLELGLPTLIAVMEEDPKLLKDSWL
jgi:regulator of PEP synthase PpsR (kinase-PPPase family)